MIRGLSFLLVLFTCFQLNAQKNHTISGYIKDNETGDVLIGANVSAKSLKKGTVADINGHYLLTLPAGAHTLTISYVGYKSIDTTLDVTGNIRLNLNLSINGALAEITITDSRGDVNVQNASGSRVDIPLERLENLPVLFGETDILKTIQLMPGVQSGGEGSNGFYVRGGGPDQNLILLDGATIYNASHLFGFFSVFNSEAISSAELIKGGMPAEYGGRTASVLDITTKEGNMDHYTGEVGIGLISSKATVEGPIIKNKASFQISGRRTYADIIMKPFLKGTNYEGLTYYFYDLNGKITYRPTTKDVISFTGYYGQDVFSLGQSNSSFSNDMSWGNGLASVKWNHIFSEKLHASLAGSFVDYKCDIGLSAGEIYQFKLFSGVQDWNARLDFGWKPNNTNTVKWGLYYTFHKFKPTAADASSGETKFDLGTAKILNTNEVSAYIQHEFEFGEKWKVNYGLRYSYFAFVGPFTRYIIDNVYDMNKMDSIVYPSGNLVQSYQGFEPRINFRYQLGKNNSLKASYTRNLQYSHLTAMSAISLPTDAWYPSTDLVKPQIADQGSLGYFHNFLDNTLETSVEVYYKYMQNLIEYRDGTDPTRSQQTNSDYDFVFGKGQSYGVEFFINKTMGKLTGWIGYTLSWTTRNFPDIMENKTFYAKYDRRHDVSIVLTYELTKKWTLSGLWVFSSGNAQTMPESFYLMNYSSVTEWGDRNGWRMPNYHRLDLSATWYFAKKKHYDANLNFSIYNVYSRQNPFYIYFDQQGDIYKGDVRFVAKQVSIFPILPSVSLTVKFK